MLAAALACASLASSCTKKLPPRPYLAFVANQLSSTVAVVNLASFRVTNSIPVPTSPTEVMARPGRQELYVLSQSGSLSVIEYPALRLTATIPVGAGAANLVLSNDGRLAALSNAAGEVVFVDCAARRVRGRAKVGGDIAGLVFTPDAGTLIAADRAGDRLIFVDTPTTKVSGEVAVGKAPGPMVMMPDGAKLFVGDTGEPKISIVDVATKQILSHLELASAPLALVLKPDGGELVALSRDSATLTILDTFHDDVEEDRPISTGKRPVAGVPTRDSTRLYIVNQGAAAQAAGDSGEVKETDGGGSVEAIDLQNRAVLGTTHVGTMPAVIALTPDERFLAVADPGTSTLAVLATGPLNPKPKVPGTPLPLITMIPVGTRPVSVTIPDWLGAR